MNIGNAVMIDLETLGRPPEAPIISIGAVQFRNNDTGLSFFRNVIPKTGGAPQYDTVMWWLDQSKAAQESLLTPEPVPEAEAWQDFHKWMNTEIRPKTVWANGATFDFTLLRNAMGRHTPWHFRQERCMRTWRDIGAAFDYPYDEAFVEGAVHHNALADAVRQARYVIEVASRIRQAKESWEEHQ